MPHAHAADEPRPRVRDLRLVPRASDRAAADCKSNMRVVAVLLIATATAFVPGHRPRPQPQPKNSLFSLPSIPPCDAAKQPKNAGDEIYKKAMVSAAGQAALALAITISSVAPAEAASDRTLKALAGDEVARARRGSRRPTAP